MSKVERDMAYGTIRRMESELAALQEELAQRESFETLYNAAIDERDALGEELAERKRKHLRSCQIAIGKSQLAKELRALCAEKDDRMSAMNKSWAAAIQQRDDLQKRLTAAEQRNADLVKAATEFMEYAECGWDHFPDVGVNLRAALKPTESGASELDPKIIGIVPMPPMEYDEP